MPEITPGTATILGILGGALAALLGAAANDWFQSRREKEDRKRRTYEYVHIKLEKIAAYMRVEHFSLINNETLHKKHKEGCTGLKEMIKDPYESSINNTIDHAHTKLKLHLKEDRIQSDELFKKIRPHILESMELRIYLSLIFSRIKPGPYFEEKFKDVEQFFDSLKKENEEICGAINNLKEEITHRYKP